MKLPVLTRVEAGGKEIRIFINGEPAQDAIVSLEVARRLQKLTQTSCGLTVRHIVPVSIGCGFGTSGAAALGIALAGSDVLRLDWTSLEAAQLAHRVEVELQTGLGTVAGEFTGGLEVRVSPGAPGVGETVRIPVNSGYWVVALHNGALPTSQLLSNPGFRRKVNQLGGTLTEELIQSPSLETFLRLSQRFTDWMDLAPPELMRAMEEVRAHGYSVGMAMLGRTAFTLVKVAEVWEVVQLLRRVVVNGRLVFAQVDEEGALLL